MSNDSTPNLEKKDIARENLECFSAILEGINLDKDERALKIIFMNTVASQQILTITMQYLRG